MRCSVQRCIDFLLSLSAAGHSSQLQLAGPGIEACEGYLGSAAPLGHSESEATQPALVIATAAPVATLNSDEAAARRQSRLRQTAAAAAVVSTSKPEAAAVEATGLQFSEGDTESRLPRIQRRSSVSASTAVDSTVAPTVAPVIETK